MDVATGTEYMPFCRALNFAGLRRIRLPARALALFFYLIPSPGFAIEEHSPLHHSADKEVWHRKENRIELFKNVRVRQPGEILTADYAILDLQLRTVVARGNCVYIAADTVIYGDEMHFNLDTRTGSIVSGRVSNDRFSLAGERINKLGPHRFQTHWGEYSTCRDCPQSWAFQAEDVDMEIEGYAFMKNVTIKVKDAPALWFPYLIVPMKTQRQTGLLFPSIKYSDQNGAMLVLPFFWAISRSVDMTFAVGEYTARGSRVEWESRYALTDRSQGRSNLYYLRDSTQPFLETPNRWAVDLAVVQELPLGIEGKIRLIEVSDNLYPSYVGDVPGKGEAVVASDFILSRSASNFSAFVAARRFRNLLNTDSDPSLRLKQFDPLTVQALPQAVITTNDWLLPSFPEVPLTGGVSLGFSNFTRSAGAFDYDQTSVAANFTEFRPGVDPIRKATRFSFTPSLYTTLRPFDILSLVPSAKYFGYFYDFGYSMDSLHRGYLLLQSDFTTQFEKIYETQDPNVPRLKHLIRPFMTFSWIPYIRAEDHPFLNQINSNQKTSGYYFDSYDIVPNDSSPSNVNYFVPLGKSLALGFTTQLIRRKGALENSANSSAPVIPTYPTYQRALEFTASQAINFRDNEKPLSRLQTGFGAFYDEWSLTGDYSYVPYESTPRHILNANFNYTFERAIHDKILYFDRSLSLSYFYNKLGCTEYVCGTSKMVGAVNYSFSDYVLPSFNTEFDVNSHRFTRYGFQFQFQSPSRCWKFSFGFGWDTVNPLNNNSQFDFQFNLTGDGFGTISNMVNKVTASQ